MNRESPAAGSGNLRDKGGERLVGIHLVDTDARLDGDRSLDSRDHRRHAVSHQVRLCHQAGAEAAALHPVAGAAEVQVDLIVAEVGAGARRHGEIRRLRTPELQRHRMLAGIEGQKALPVAVQDRSAGDHLGVEQRVSADATQEGPVVPVGPVHHGGNAEPHLVHESFGWATRLSRQRTRVQFGFGGAILQGLPARANGVFCRGATWQPSALSISMPLLPIDPPRDALRRFSQVARPLAHCAGCGPADGRARPVAGPRDIPF